MSVIFISNWSQLQVDVAGNYFWRTAFEYREKEVKLKTIQKAHMNFVQHFEIEPSGLFAVKTQTLIFSRCATGWNAETIRLR